MKKNTLLFIDQTIREGMLFHGMVFSLEERLKMLDFQERLGIPVSQAAYPASHKSEMLFLNRLVDYAGTQGYCIRVAGHGRALKTDVAEMVKAGCQDYHLHTGVNSAMLTRLGFDRIYAYLEETVLFIRESHPDSAVKVSLLDVGNSSRKQLMELVQRMAHALNVNIITLPDTSGVMLPRQYAALVSDCTRLIQGSHASIAVHCHNDLGLAAANTLAGTEAGARVVEAAVLGIGERNGIADLALSAHIADKAGFEIPPLLKEVDILEAYYNYVNDLVEKKTGFSMTHYETPVFGRSLSTMGAGSHGIGEYGVTPSTQFFINHMCGRSLVRRYLKSHSIQFEEFKLPEIVQKIKEQSVQLQRALTEDEIQVLLKD